MIKIPKKIIFMVGILGFCLSFVSRVFAYPTVSIAGVNSVSFENAMHHGLQIQASGIADPNLTFYEVQLKEDTGLPSALWSVYNAELQPYDNGTLINIPYRNGILELIAGKTYCVRVRGIYGKYTTNWAEQCGITVTVPSVTGGDSDGDGISDSDEYSLYGTDPFDVDSDRDGINDGTEIANGSDPNEALYPDVIVHASIIDFGSGNPFGYYLNQHQVLEIKNIGSEVADIASITVLDGSQPGSAGSFLIGAYPDVLTNIPPQSTLYLPLSFLPQWRGDIEATLEISLNNGTTTLSPVTLKGYGVEIPDCQISPLILNFGTVAVNSSEVSLQYVTIKNSPSEEDSTPANMNTNLGFTLSTTDLEMAPGIRGFILALGEEMTVPVLFQHKTAGNHDSLLEIYSAHCGKQLIELKGTAE